MERPSRSRWIRRLRVALSGPAVQGGRAGARLSGRVVSTHPTAVVLLGSMGWDLMIALVVAAAVGIATLVTWNRTK